VNPVEAALAEAHRHEWARVLAATARVAMDLDLAEECVQEASAAALRSWAVDGIPGNPAAGLTTTARRRAIDAIRRDAADPLARLGRADEAAAAYRRAVELTANEAERAFFAGRLAARAPGE
jgi:predicted RNA polymerase sigma factor